MQIIPPQKVVAATRLGFLPKRLPPYPYAGEPREAQLQIWQMVVSQNATTDWGVCNDCFADISNFSSSKPGDAPAHPENTTKSPLQPPASPPQTPAIEPKKKLHDAVRDLPFSLIEIKKAGDLETKLPQLLQTLGSSAGREVGESEFKMLVTNCASWGFASALHGSEVVVLDVLIKKMRENGATRVGWTKSRPFGDVAMQKTHQAGIHDSCLVLLADSSGGPVFAYAIAPRTYTSPGVVKEWWVAGHGMSNLPSGVTGKEPSASPSESEKAANSASVTAQPSPVIPEQQISVGDTNETIGEVFKLLGMAVLVSVVGLLAFNMAKYNHARLPNPIAFVMMLVTGGFAVICAFGAVAFICNAIAAFFKDITRK